MAFLFPLVGVRVNGILRRSKGGTTSHGFDTNFATARVEFAADEQPAQPGDKIAITLGYTSTTPQLCFVGEADDDTLDYWPLAPGVSASGFLARLQRGRGASQDGAPEDDQGDVPAYYATNVADNQIATDLLAIWGVAPGDIQGDTPATHFGTIEPVALPKNSPPWQLIQELDRLTFMRTFDGPDGLVRRLPTNSKPASPALTLTQGVDLLPGSSRGRSRRQLVNWVTMRGLPQGPDRSLVPLSERKAPAPIVNGVPLIPTPPTYVSEEWQSNLAETEAVCGRYAARRIDQLNRLAETIQVRLDRCRPDIRAGMSIGLAVPKLGYDSRYVMWVSQVEHSWQANAAYTTLTLIVATAEAGLNPNQPPVPVIHYTVEQEYADGVKVWLVRASGRDSYDPDGVAIDLDPQHGITSYLWSGTPVGPATPAALPEATYVYTSDPTGAQICLTVGDVHLLLATTCVTITAKDVQDALIRDLWAAVTSDLLLSTDGGGTWVGVGVAAVGLAEEAHPNYQLAYTALTAGDLWKVTLADDGLTYHADLVLAGKGITAVSINNGIDGSGTGRCWAGSSDGKVYFSPLDGAAGSWSHVGTIGV